MSWLLVSWNQGYLQIKFTKIFKAAAELSFLSLTILKCLKLGV